MKIIRFRDIKTYTSSGHYAINVGFEDLPRAIRRYQEDTPSKLDLNPEFQRAHVWTEAQQVAFVEYALRGGKSGQHIYFNCVGWMNDFRGPFVVVDGKQRIHAAMAFLENKIQAFGSYYKEFEDSLARTDAQFIFVINNLKTREEVLRLYLQLNEGGTPHSPEELEKVRGLIASIKEAA